MPLRALLRNKCVSKREIKEMKEANDLAQLYIATWNERDAGKRLELVAKTYTESGLYIDPVRSGKGHEEISAMIATVQQQFSAYVICLKGEPDAHNDRLRFQWQGTFQRDTGGVKEAPAHFVGTDFGIIAGDGRFASITGFVDVRPETVSKS
jgi:hypothetical protein